MPLKIVLDTNVWVSYFINARTDYLVKWIIDHDVTIFTSDQLANEIKDVLNRPKFKKQFPYPVHDFISLHLQVCEKVKVSKQFNFAPDPDDNFLFDLCSKADAAYLVTSDKRLLEFSPPFPLETITFNELRSMF
jgi:putative PIN family toxin of toxin-antitoxin system